MICGNGMNSKCFLISYNRLSSVMDIKYMLMIISHENPRTVIMEEVKMLWI